MVVTSSSGNWQCFPAMHTERMSMERRHTTTWTELTGRPGSQGAVVARAGTHPPSNRAASKGAGEQGWAWLGDTGANQGVACGHGTEGKLQPCAVLGAR